MADSVVENRAPLARCCHCGNPEVIGICHQCRQPVCLPHSYTMPRRLGQWLFRRFVGLSLEGTPCGPDPLTCTSCLGALWTPGAWLILVGSSMTLVTLTGLGFGFLLAQLFKVNTLLAAQRGWFVVAMLIGLILLLTGLLYRGRRPFLPILWRPTVGRVVETLSGSITFDAQARLQTQMTSCTGKLDWAGELDSAERARVKAYRRRFRIAESDNLDFRAGFALLKGRFSGILTGRPVNAERHGHVLRLDGRVHEQAFLRGDNTRTASQWNVSASYSLPAPSTLPVRLIPHLVEARNERTLELELQWDDLDGLTDVEITELRVETPRPWGAVVQASDGALTNLVAGDGTDAGTVLKWHAPPLDSHQRQVRRRSFDVHCERNLDQTRALRGQATLTWKGAISRLEGIALFFPLGRPDARGTLSIKSSVVVDFELSLAGLRYQEVRIVPDAQNPQDRDRGEPIRSLEIMPNSALVDVLTTALLEAGYLVYQVVESPPQADNRRGVVFRQWDVKGRTYHGVCAVDFHVGVRGEIGGKALQVELKLTTRGLATQSAGERTIERTWRQLRGVVKTTLNTRVQKVLMIPDAQPERLSLRSPSQMVLLRLRRHADGDLLEGDLSSPPLLVTAPAAAADADAPENE